MAKMLRIESCWECTRKKPTMNAFIDAWVCEKYGFTLNYVFDLDPRCRLPDAKEEALDGKTTAD